MLEYCLLHLCTFLLALIAATPAAAIFGTVPLYIFHYCIIILILDHQWFILFFSWDIYTFFGISVSLSTVSELFCSKTLEIFVISFNHYNSNHQLLWLFLEFLFWSSFKSFCSRLFSMVRRFLAVFTANAFIMFLMICLPILLT